MFTFSNSSIMTMVHLVTISLLLLPLVTASGDEFWDDVDMMDHNLSDPEDTPTQPLEYNELSDPEDLPTQATTNKTSLVEPMPKIPQHSLSSNTNENKTLKRRVPENMRFFQKYITLRATDIEKFERKLLVDDSQNMSLTIIQDTLVALGNVHEWINIHTYEVDKYPKYWAKVCVIIWDNPLVKRRRVACIVSRRYSHQRKLGFQIGKKKHYFDLLSCRCHTYLTNCRIHLSTPETFLIHKGNRNEFFIFEDNELEGKLSIKGFKNGITLPNPSDSERNTKSSAKFISKSVSIRHFEIKNFNRALKINESYPQNITLAELKDKLMELEEIHEWPDLFKYDYESYSRYWAKVCVFFWGKPLDNSHRQACLVSPRSGDSKIHKFFMQDRIQNFDLLYCKCHFYKSNIKYPASSADTFLIHQSSADEFFVFEQRVTDYCHYTLFIKDFKGGITLPNPEDFN